MLGVLLYNKLMSFIADLIGWVTHDVLGAIEELRKDLALLHLMLLIIELIALDIVY